MDRGPYRAPQHTNRVPASRPAQTRSEESQPSASAPSPTRPSATHHTAKKSDKPKSRVLLIVAIIVGVLVVAAGGWFFGTKQTGTGAPGIDSSKYQAVFFTNGQVYFGKLQSVSNGYLKLTDIFYLQTKNDEGEADSKNPQKATSDQSSDVQLIKLGNEVHGPEDEMIISKDQVLFYENLKKDGKVSQTIEQSKNNK